MGKQHDGGCLCGALCYCTTDAPLRLVMCHCHFCQRSTGAAYAVEPFFLKDDFQVTEGAPAVYVHQSSGSGKALHLHFCSRCGTKIFTIFERYADVMSVFAGTFDDPEWFEPPAVTRHVYLSSARSGTVIAPGIDVYLEGSFAADGQSNIAHAFKDFHIVHR